MEFLTEPNFKQLSNSGVTSPQMLSPHNSSSLRITVTRVTVAPGASQPRHLHATSEQVWIAMEGSGKLLLGDNEERAFGAGEVARFSEGEIHGFENNGISPFVYISVTSPPINFDRAYGR